MERVIEAIEKVYQLSDKRTQDFIHSFYFARPRTLTIDGIAQKLFVSRRNVFYIRHNIVRRLAVELGWW
jgi:RinA family phage transcriptional activator